MPPSEVVASAPARVDLAGGWTDVAPYTTEIGGAVCNVAVELRAVATVTRADQASLPTDEPLVRAAWERAGQPAVTMHLHSTMPRGSGLGGSSAAGVALAAALAAWRDQQLEAADLAELSRSTEIETLGVAGGCQDHYSAAFGGALLLRCSSKTVAENVHFSETAIAAFEARAMIAYTGESRMSANTINAVLDAYRDGEQVTCDALARMKSLAFDMAGALQAGDIDEVGALLRRHWVAQRALHPSITTPLIDCIVAEAESAGALGTKALGASGGGCVLVIARRDRVEQVRRAVGIHASFLPLRVARTGVQVHVTRGTG
jgi:D-glycero-alpha-D-manno-heptose-7-phosphate kinase